MRAASPVTAPSSVTFAVPATQYNGPTDPPPSTALGDFIIRRVRDTALGLGRPTPIPDERLYLATAALAAVVPESGRVPYSLVEFAFQTNGIIEPSPHLLVVWGSLYGSGGAEILATLQPALERVLRDEHIVRVGVGAALRGRGGDGAVVLALHSSRIRTTPIPRVLPSGGTTDFEVFADNVPTAIYVMSPDGRVESIDAAVNDTGALAVHAACGATDGKMVIEIGTDEGTLAKFPVWCGVEAPRTHVITAFTNDLPSDSREAERRVLDLVNRDRAAIGQPALRMDETVRAIAREHAQEMAKTNEVADRVSGVTVARRVQQLRPDLQNVGAFGRAYGLAEAHEGVMGLPSTRRKLMSDVATIAGIGIAYGRMLDGFREVYVSEVIAAPK